MRPLVKSEHLVAAYKPEQIISNRFFLEDTHWFYRGVRTILKNNFEKILRDYGNNKVGDTICILDVGCGSGATLKLLEHYGKVHGIDISELAIQYSKKRNLKNLQVGSAEDLPYSDNSFDFVFSVQVFCNIPGSDLKAWREVRRVLKPGGYFFSLLPAYNFLFSPHDIAAGSFRRYDKAYILNASKKSGLRVTKISFYNTLLFPLIFILRLLSKFLCKQPKSDLNNELPILNFILSGLMYLEVALSDIINYPFGLSILSIHKKG
ncbi:MAG: class I SAM-dependent methyltransferase [Candidatus Melainabacteria bacterium]|nr:class I SAM-dependent methyltransferase [Candidatus Melainabacteria bacterium]